MQRGEKKDRNCYECHAPMRFFFEDVQLEFFGYAGGFFQMPELPGGSDDEDDDEDEDGGSRSGSAARSSRDQEKLAQRHLQREAQGRAQRGLAFFFCGLVCVCVCE